MEDSSTIVRRAIDKLKADADARAAMEAPSEPVQPQTSAPMVQPEEALAAASAPVAEQPPAVKMPEQAPIPVGIAAPELLPAPAAPGIPAALTAPQPTAEQMPIILEAQGTKPQSAAEMQQNPSTLAPALPNLPSEVQKAITTPTPQEVAQAVEQEAEPLRRQQAKDAAKVAVKAEAIDAAAQEAQDQQKAKDSISAVDKEVRARSLPEIFATGSMGDKFGMILALALGGVSQGLLNSKTNPVVDFIDKQVDQQAVKDKLSLEERESLRKQAFQAAELKIKDFEAKTQNQDRKARLALMQSDLNLRANQLFADQLQAKMATGLTAKIRSGMELNQEDINQMTDKQYATVATLPDGRRVATVSERAKNEFDKYAEALSGAQTALNKLIAISNKPIPPKGTPERMKLESEVELHRTAVKGGIRVPYFGPGQFIEAEQARADRIVGDPTAFFSITGNQRNLLQKLKEDLDLKYAAAAKRAGIRTQVVPEIYRVENGEPKAESKLLREFMADRVAKKLPPITAERALEAIRKQYPEMEATNNAAIKP